MKVESSEIKRILSEFRAKNNPLNLRQKLAYLKSWINFCNGSEDYELASELLKEKVKIIREIRFSKIGKRSLLNFFKLYVKIYFRRFLNIFN